MPVDFVCPEAPLDSGDAEKIWAEVCQARKWPDDQVAVRCVAEEQMQMLNRQYRQRDRATNVLTFSYGDGVHDVALSLDVAKREAAEVGIAFREYVAWLITHAMLHAAGMDHERSEAEASETENIENMILRASGFRA